MTKAKTTPKKKAAVKWDKVESVAPKTTPKPKVAQAIDGDTVPFGGTNEVEQIIRSYRKHVKKNAVPKNGSATAPDGTKYNYYLTEDVMEHADAFCEANGGFLQSWIENVEGSNVIKLTLEHTNSGQVKQVSANLGRPSSMADFGGRISYSPKYLVAMLFGISVQTDTDAYHNGTTKDNTTTNAKDKSNGGGEVKKTAKKGAEGQGGGVSKQPDSRNDSPSVDSSSTPDNVSSVSGRHASVAEGVESASFKAAKAFIGKAYSEVMLNEAETKLANSQKLSDSDKEALSALVSQKREDIKK